jgi:hypothetical protein
LADITCADPAEITAGMMSAAYAVGKTKFPNSATWVVPWPPGHPRSVQVDQSTKGTSSADGAGDLQVVVTVGAAIYHEIRYADGSWSSLNFQTTAPGPISSISGAIG